MKRLFSILSILMILSLMLAACGAPAAEEAASPTEAVVVEAPAEEAAEAPTEAAEAEEAVEVATEAAVAEEAVEAPTEAAAEAPAEKETLNVWSFSNSILSMAIAYEGYNPDVDIVYTMIPMTNGEYQTKLKSALGTADAPDVVVLEAAFVKEFVEADGILADLNDLLPYAEAAQTYPAVVEVGTHEGVTKAFSYQATPGALFYRRSLAKEYFGTDDPEEIQALLSDFDKFIEAAARAIACFM